MLVDDDGDDIDVVLWTWWEVPCPCIVLKNNIGIALLLAASCSWPPTKLVRLAAPWPVCIAETAETVGPGGAGMISSSSSPHPPLDSELPFFDDLR